jgi:hypothetical protein
MIDQKREAIKKAWAEFWDGFPDHQQNRIIDNGGFADTCDTMFEGIRYPYAKDERFKVQEMKCSAYGYNRITPKSIIGIDNNNGWLSVKEHGLPKEQGEYHVVVDYDMYTEKPYNQSTEYFQAGGIVWGHVTHYQPVVKPKPPIY